MIYTITPNPVLDLSGTTKQIIPNEKNYVSSETRSPGGNGINVARIAHTLGEKVMVSGFLGGAVGDEIHHLLQLKKIPQAFIEIKENTRINLTISNLKSHEQTRFSFPGPAISQTEKKLMRKYILTIPKSSVVVFGGSLPHQVTAKDIALMIKALNKKKCICVVDMPGLILKDLIDTQPFLIKPNLSEFQTLVRKKVKTIGEILPVAKKMTKKIPVICISSVEDGALLVTKNYAWFGTIPKVKIYSSVGAGDSMVGAFVTKLAPLSKRYDKDELAQIMDTEGSQFLQFSLAAACGTLTQPGVELASKKSIDKFFAKIKIRQLN